MTAEVAWGEVSTPFASKGECQGSAASLRNTVNDRQPGTFLCGDTIVVQGQIRTSDGVQFKFPKSQDQLSCCLFVARPFSERRIDMRKLLLSSLLAVALVVVFLAGAAVAFAPYSGDIAGYGSRGEPQRITSITAIINCPAGVTFLGRANARMDGVEIFIGKFKGTCTGSDQPINTVQGQSFGTLDCFDQFIMRGQIRTSSGVRFKLPDDEWEIFCI